MIDAATTEAVPKALRSEREIDYLLSRILFLLNIISLVVNSASTLVLGFGST